MPSFLSLEGCGRRATLGKGRMPSANFLLRIPTTHALLKILHHQSFWTKARNFRTWRSAGTFGVSRFRLRLVGPRSASALTLPYGSGYYFNKIKHIYIYVYATPSDLPFGAFLSLGTTRAAQIISSRKGREQYTAMQFNSRQRKHLRKNCCMNAEPPANAFETKLLYSHL